MNTKYKSLIMRNGSALTFVEILVVGITITIIAFVLMMVIFSEPGQRQKARSSFDMSHLRQIAVVMISYSVDHDGLLPVHPRDAMQDFSGPSDIRDIYRSIYQEENAAIDRGDFDGPATRFGGYVFLNLGIDLDDIEKPSELILAYTAKVLPEQIRRNVLFADGHTEQWDEDRFRAALPPGVDVDALDGP